MPVTGWKLDAASREFLLEIFPPRWPDLVADHVTLHPRATPSGPLPSQRRAEVIGHADDGEGLEALVVAIDGSAARPDGSIFHITWSLDRKRARKPVESNALLARDCWQRLAAPIAIDIIPARF